MLKEDFNKSWEKNEEVKWSQGATLVCGLANVKMYISLEFFLWSVSIESVGAVVC